MNVKFRLTILSAIFFVGLISAQTPDSTKKKVVAPKKIEIAESVRLPNPNERLTVLGVAVVLVGGLGLILNEKRRRADKRHLTESK
jgi:hypothetical protein